MATFTSTQKPGERPASSKKPFQGPTDLVQPQDKPEVVPGLPRPTPPPEPPAT